MTNEKENTRVSVPKRQKYAQGKLRDVLLIAALAMLLLFVSWRVFRGNSNSTNTALTMTESEAKVSKLLEQIDGVGKANVVVCETEEGVQSVVVVCEGAENLRVTLNVREAVCAALGTEQNQVKIYLKTNKK